MMDHGYFDGPFRGGHCRSGKPYIFSQEWRDHLKRKAAEKAAKAKEV